MLQRNVGASGGLVMQDSMAMEKSAAAAILPCETDRVALLNEARVREVLGTAPIQRQIAINHFFARLHDGEHARMQTKIRRISRDGFSQDPQTAHIDARLYRLPIGAEVLAPINGVAIADEPQSRTRLRLALIQTVAILL